MTHPVGLRACWQPLAWGMVALLAGCGRHDPVKTIALNFDLSPDQKVAEAVLAVGAVRTIELNPNSLTCRGAGEFKEYRPGAPVTIENERREVIGSGLLGPGRIMKTSLSPTGVRLFQGCRFEARIPLHAPARIYGLNIANGKYRAYVHVTRLREQGGKLSADLG